MTDSPRASASGTRPARAGAIALATLLFCGLPSLAHAQSTRTAISADALIAGATFFHGKSVVLLQRFSTEGEITQLMDAPKPIYVFWRDRPTSDRGEVRGEFLDLGRMEAGDPRLTAYDFSRLLETVNRGQWPRRDQIYVLLAASLLPSSPPRAPTLRAIALAPDDYVEREVRVVGRFKGRNLYGDLPTALGKGKWDFVLQSADGALWVTGVRPKGKDFDLDPSRRVDTGRWLEVTGVVKREGVMTYIDARAAALASEPQEKTIEVDAPPPPKMPPPAVIFSAPIADDTDIERTSPVRIQFSQDMEARSIRDRVRVSYVVAPGSEAPPVPRHSVVYNDVSRAIEIRFQDPLEAFRDVKVELLEGIAAIDGQRLPPWTLTFTTGR